ncbi:MAG: hypothetical protein U1F36_16785 [Planctomycetota bacterium]
MSTRTPKAKKSTSSTKTAAAATAAPATAPAPRRQPAAPRSAPTRRTDDLLLAGASSSGTPFGRCGGRAILTRLERDLCDRLTGLGVAHSHRPRHFEVSLENKTLAAYAPTMVLRGRGREGKTVVIETAEQAQDPNLSKIRAYRKQYGLEFYVCLVAPEEVLDEVHFDTYDEATSATDVHTLVSRLAD